MKSNILHLLNECVGSRDEKLFKGEELGYQLLDECTLVTASYQTDGEYIGVLGVLGLARMAYERVIPLVAATALS